MVTEQVDTSLTLYLSSVVPDDRYRDSSLEAAAGHLGIWAWRLRTLAAEGQLEARRPGKCGVTWPGAAELVGKPR